MHVLHSNYTFPLIMRGIFLVHPTRYTQSKSVETEVHVGAREFRSPWQTCCAFIFFSEQNL